MFVCKKFYNLNRRLISNRSALWYSAGKIALYAILRVVKRGISKYGRKENKNII